MGDGRNSTIYMIVSRSLSLDHAADHVNNSCSIYKLGDYHACCMIKISLYIDGREHGRRVCFASEQLGRHLTQKDLILNVEYHWRLSCIHLHGNLKDLNNCKGMLIIWLLIDLIYAGSQISLHFIFTNTVVL